jgi:hypothetical protein
MEVLVAQEPMGLEEAPQVGEGVVLVSEVDLEEAVMQKKYWVEVEETSVRSLASFEVGSQRSAMTLHHTFP